MAKWTMQVNVAGIPFFEPGGSFDRLQTGAYEVVVEAAEKEASKTAGKADNLVFGLKVAKGPEAGKTVKRWLSTDFTDRDGINLKEMKNLLATVVKNPAKLEEGNANIGDTTFVGKTAFIYYKAPAPGEKDAKTGKAAYPNINFITREQMAKLSEVGAGAGAGATATGVQGTMGVKGGAAQNGAPAAAEAVDLE